MSSTATTRQDRPEHGPWDQPLFFWREEDGRRTGLACLPTFCDNPACTCQEVFLQAFEVDDRFQKISVHGEHVRVLSEKKGGPPPEGQLFAVVDLETGRLIRVDHASPRQRKAELLRRLEESIDAKTLADLRARWQSYKEELKAESSTVDAWRSQDWTKWDGAEPVGWYEVHPETPEDRYQLGRDTYDAADFYCIIPGCDCAQVTVRFGKVVDDEIAQVIGEVFVEPSGCEVVGTGNAPGERRVLETLWALYEESHDLSELSRRYRAMQRLGPEIHALRDRQLRPAPVRRGAKVGRNEPCPCGSGQKYKKCCGAG